MNFVFDFDSTILQIESLDFLLSQVSNGKFDKEIQEITNLGMSGKASLHETLTRRLKICNITRQNLENSTNIMQKYLTKGIAKIITNIQKNHNVYIVSGGLIDLILPVAQVLNIPKEHCMANQLIFQPNGEFKEINLTSSLLYKNGKSKALESLNLLNSNTIMIGDGYTDLEVHLNNPSVKFIGFGINIVRDIVQKDSPVFIHTIEDFSKEIDNFIHT